MPLQRFHHAQANRHGGYETALAEMCRGRKTSHWIWYIFPQLAGLGQSHTALTYALSGLDEACDYLRDPLLRARYVGIVDAVATQLTNDQSLENLMGGELDAQKLVSSLTLFQAAASRLAAEDPDCAALSQRLAALLEQTTAHGFPPCAFTLGQIKG